MSEQACVVVVTYNRKMLLMQCLEAILQQTQPAQKILIIDNASTDGTYELLQSKDHLKQDTVEYVPLPFNVGGAGGFHAGLKRAYEAGFEWLWVMDDDSIPEPDALEQLFKAYHRFAEGQRPRLLSSKVIWSDGSLHAMNITQPKTFNSEQAYDAAQQATMSIRYATFVSLLLHRSLIRTYGLPLADYFIWSDDLEYTARILRDNLGVLVPDSLVLHKTAKKYTYRDDVGERYYYHIRNNIWMLTRSKAWLTNEKIKKTIHFMAQTATYLLAKFRWQRIKLVFRGVKDGLFRSPKI